MKRHALRFARWWLAVFACLPAVAAAAGLRIAEPRCEYGVDPLGIDVAEPRLSWRVESDERAQVQTAYRILVASSPEALAREEGDLWDTGRIDSADTLHVPYAGAPLRSSQRVYWSVRAWDREGRPSAWSEPSTWTMGLLTVDEWKGRWIVAPWTSEALLVRHEFPTRGEPKRALLHVCGLGQYEAFLNGERIGEDLLSPGWTNYHETSLYDTHDVTALVRAGANAIGLALGPGMNRVERRNRFAKFVGSYGPLRAVVHLEIEYADGSVDVIGSDETWRVHRGPITYSSIFGGEDYDARLEQPGWNQAGFDASMWERAVPWVRPPLTQKGYSYAAEPLRAIEARAPVEVRKLSDTVVLYDFGQNASFMPRLRVSGPRGSVVRMTAGEVVNDDGTIDRGTMGGAHRGSAWWQYTKGSDDEETWFPQFYYVGSRYLYVELTAADDGSDAIAPTLPVVEQLDMVIVHSIARPLGHFATSNPLLNRIRDLVRWAQRSNMVSTLTDCPHREKLGWIEQYHLNGPSIRYEFDVARIFTKGMHDMRASQTDEGLIPNITPEFTEFKGAFRGAAEWGAAFFLVPWQQYRFTGDTGPMRTHYDAMKRYFAYLESRTRDGLLHDGLGDWYDLLLGKKGRAGLTPAPITATAFLYYDAVTLARIAELLGHEDDARDYAARAERIRERYNEAFLKTSPKVSYGTDSQCSLALPLVMGIVPDEHRAAVLQALVDDVEERRYATAGDIGFRYMLQALAQAGRSDVIYALINQDELPGYGYQLKMGATALTESWDASRGASHNHFMLGQVIEWFYKDLAGIDVDNSAPGFGTIAIRPQPVPGLDWVEARYESIRGPIEVRWDQSEARFLLRVRVPANTTAEVHLPAAAGSVLTESGSPLESSPGVAEVTVDAGVAVVEIGSGEYVFEVTRP
ncbi:glycoside hydrolase family 78 protein [Opitutales bacterium ASA1]|uniref:family 78 glycoside hydrolase catalytic domain n=1 Tax=Congregicoccus parvus TaxID=3081749 RepID=UPI002B31B48D|nr:glycoside hydrolase family 78 protein [Opitutales bacterium ASA1]